MIPVTNFAVSVTRKHKPMPITVGIAAAASVHFMLPDSFLIVISVVEHGQCIKENSITLIAVT